MVSKNLEKQLFDLKFAAKSLERSSRKSSKLENEEKGKVKKMIEKGNVEGARIHAEAAIRHHNQSLHLLQLSNRVDAMSSQLSTSMSMKNVA
jgi:charged multivesicular body protein 1